MPSSFGAFVHKPLLIDLTPPPLPHIPPTCKETMSALRVEKWSLYPVRISWALDHRRRCSSLLATVQLGGPAPTRGDRSRSKPGASMKKHEEE